MENKDLTLISDYFAGDLGEDQSLAFEKRMEQEASFRQMVNQYMEDLILLRADHRAEVKQEIKAQFNAYQKRRVTTRTLWLSMVVAAAISLFFLFFLDQPQATLEELAMAYEEPFAIRTERGESTEVPAEIQLYQEGAYAKALPLWKDRASTPLEEFYLAECYRLIGQYPEAIDIYLNLLSQTQIKDAVQWRLALSYVLAGREKEAIEELTEISSQDHYRKDEAKELLDALD